MLSSAGPARAAGTPFVTAVNLSLTSAQTITGSRAYRNDVAAQCGSPAQYPGDYASGTLNYATAPYTAPANGCLTLTKTSDTCPNGNVNPTHWLLYSSFDPSHQSSGFLGHAGSSEFTSTFGVRVTAGTTYTVVAYNSWHQQDCQVSLKLSLDPEPPETTLTGGPAQGSTVPTSTASFTIGGTGASSFECSVDTGSFAACTSPVDLTGLADGSHTLSVRAKDAVGNVDPTPATRTWTVDTTPPDTVIDSGPTGTTASTTTSFTFHGTPGSDTASYECSLDSIPFVGCSSPAGISGLPQGTHTFRVRAKDAAGNVDPTPVTRTWTVDTVAPDTVIDSGPTGTVAANNASFTFHGTPAADTAGYECKVDSGSYLPCVDSLGAYGLTEGDHTFSVRAKDAVGNTDATPATRTWTIDTTAPDTVIDSGPTGTVTATSASFTFHGDPGTDTSSYECSLDGAAYAACPNPAGYTNLADGSHTFSVRAKDAVGNTDPTPATRTWTIDTTAPDTVIDSGPTTGSTLSATTATFAFHGTPAGDTTGYECSLDSAVYTTCTSPATYTGLAEGPHTFTVRAHDAQDNTDTTPATRTWTIDTTAPETSIISGPRPGTTTTSHTATFELTSHGNGHHFECRLDDAAWRTCQSPVTYTDLATGTHTFAARAIDTAGNTDPTPDTTTWTITNDDGTTPPPDTTDTTAPQTLLTRYPTGTTHTTTATFAFTSPDTDTTSYECSLDGADYTTCTSPATYTDLTDGTHTLAVRATDHTGNTDPTPALATWTIDTTAPTDTTDTTAPQTRITSKTNGRTYHRHHITVKFTATDNTGGHLTYQCRLDHGPWKTCTNPKTYRGLTNGHHTLRIRATDQAGNTDPTPAKATFTIKPKH